MIDTVLPGLDVLNCGLGHLSINFDKEKPEEVDRAKKVIQDMLGRGYTIVIETYNQDTNKVETHKVDRFDPKNDHYIITEPDEREPTKRQGRPKGVPLNKARGTGIGRTAGG